RQPIRGHRLLCRPDYSRLRLCGPEQHQPLFEYWPNLLGADPRWAAQPAHSGSGPADLLRRWTNESPIDNLKADSLTGATGCIPTHRPQLVTHLSTEHHGVSAGPGKQLITRIKP